MSELLQFDDEVAKRLEAVYTTPDVVAQRRTVLEMLDLRPGENVLDIGSGPGFLACEMAEAVGPEGSVDGVDPSESMLQIAGRRARPAGSGRTSFVKGDALTLPFPDASFDVVTSTQVYEYVADVAGALAEVHRVLRPAGRLLVLDTDWDSIVWRSSDVGRMQRVLEAWEEHLTDAYLPRRLDGLLRGQGFTVRTRAVIPLLNVGFEEQTYSAGMMRIMGQFVPGRRGVSAEEAQAWQDDLRALGGDYFFSLNRYSFLAGKSR